MVPGLNEARQPTPVEGMTFSAMVPVGYRYVMMGPMGPYWVFPPGAPVQPVAAACMFVEAVNPMMVPMLMRGLSSMDNPFAAAMHGGSVGLARVTSVAPARQTTIGGAVAHLREIEGVSAMSGQPLRGTLMLLCGSRGVAKVIMFVNLFRANEFMGDCLRFIGTINVNGYGAVSAPTVQAVVDRTRLDQIEFRLKSDRGEWQPITAMPTRVEGQVVINIDQSFHVGNISGVGHAIGHHSVSKVGT